MRIILRTRAAKMLVNRTPIFHSLTLIHLTSKPSSLKTLPYTRTAISTSAVELTTTESRPHPWPEWVSFVDCLYSRGYFPYSSSARTHNSLVYQDITVLKDPCLSFARDRYDIFPSLSKGEIKNIVEVGCPKIVRKVINSAKRLRAYVGLDEKEVCDVCSLRGSCDRAFVLPNTSESLRTVDIMRLLLFYALDPMIVSGAERPPSFELAESSARRLLTNLIDLSEASNPPLPAEPSKRPSNKTEKIFISKDAELSEDVARKKQDWICPMCSFLNYARNTQCKKCSEDGPKLQIGDVEQKKGDWNCPECGCLNFAKRRDCFKCSVPRPRQTLDPGDWLCPKCEYLNFRRNINCLKCGSEHSRKAALEASNPGDWVCPKCDYLNFKKNDTCRECGSERIKEAACQKDHVWRKPNVTLAD